MSAIKIIKQRKNFTSREIRIEKAGCYSIVSFFGNEGDEHIPYERITGEKRSQEKTNFLLLLFSIGLLLCSIPIIVVRLLEPDDYIFHVDTGIFIIAVILVFVFFLSRKKFWMIMLTENRCIMIHKNIPQKSEVNQFINDLMYARNTYLKKRYLLIDPKLSYQKQYANLKWLLDIDVIKEDDFDIYYRELQKNQSNLDNSKP